MKRSMGRRAGKSMCNTKDHEAKEANATLLTRQSSKAPTNTLKRSLTPPFAHPAPEKRDGKHTHKLSHVWKTEGAKAPNFPGGGAGGAGRCLLEQSGHVEDGLPGSKRTPFPRPLRRCRDGTGAEDLDGGRARRWGVVGRVGARGGLDTTPTPSLPHPPPSCLSSLGKMTLFP